MIKHISVKTRGQGLHEITDAVTAVVRASGVSTGLCTVFVRHTSASLIIQENADPSVRRDLEDFLKRLVPEDERLYTHNDEGEDDMPSHIKAALTATSLAIPIEHGQLTLGTWQGLYLWEHRYHSHDRDVVVHVA